MHLKKEKRKVAYVTFDDYPTSKSHISDLQCCP